MQWTAVSFYETVDKRATFAELSLDSLDDA